MFATWKWPKGPRGESFLLQFVPKEQDGNEAAGRGQAHNVLSYEGERVDLDAMDALYRQISQRR